MRLYILIDVTENTNPAQGFFRANSPEAAFRNYFYNKGVVFRKDILIIDIVAGDNDSVDTLKWDEPSQTWVVTETHQINL